MGWLYFGIWCFIGIIIFTIGVRQDAAHGKNIDFSAEDDAFAILLTLGFFIIVWPVTLIVVLMDWAKYSGKRKFEQKQREELDKREKQG